MSLFAKLLGSFDSFDSGGITDSAASFKPNYYTGWIALVNNVEYIITGNTASTLYFSNQITAVGDYEIAFIGRNYLIQFESDCSNLIKIPDQLITSKYYIADTDLTNEVTVYLRGLNTSSFNPLNNILNLTVLQPAFAYHVLDLIYRDLMIDGSSYEAFKSLDMYRKDYSSSLSVGKALLEVDYNQNGTADPNEVRISASTVFFSR